MSDAANPDARGLHQAAYAQDGYFTSRQAREFGFSPQLLAHHVHSGRYERVHRGLYRLSAYPGSSNEELRAKWLAVGGDRAVISHQSALGLHELSDVLPNAVHVLVDRRARGLKPPDGVVLHTTSTPLAARDIVTREGIRVTSAIRSILDAATSGAQPEQIEMAVGQALERGLTTPKQLSEQAANRSRRVRDLIARSIEQAGAE